uniref:Uncharacterized protein n=1 Tax=Haptolina brevifila TaxID=156173 RepID=A0A7S2IKX2_9EUKA|mmetsp:Transcript_67152/g.133075  ORF Transcript_67152/g.133075 Transcript_67152/m.133075 type:complete len:208 (+) Transcript_67152:4938-5561(+)
MGMSQARFDLLLKLLSASSVSAIRVSAASLAERAKKRYDAKNSKDKRYINIYGGPASDPSMARALRELGEAGFALLDDSGHGCVSVVDGPLLRATDGSRISHMPVDPSTTYPTWHKMFDKAYELANPEGDPDPWLDLQGLTEPLWGHHSLRRLADTVARVTMDRTGVREDDIDLIFGWNEKMYNQTMQHHYATRFNREKRYRVTRYL